MPKFFLGPHGRIYARDEEGNLINYEKIAVYENGKPYIIPPSEIKPEPEPKEQQ